MLKFLRNEFGWNWLNELIGLTKMAGLIALAIAIVWSYGWLTLNYRSTMWWIGTAIVGFVLFCLGAWGYQATHKCERRRVAICNSCEAVKADREAVVTTEKVSLEVLKALVYGSQDQLDELLEFFTERVQAACAEESHLNEINKGAQLTPKNALRREKLTTKIAYYHRIYTMIVNNARRFNLIVSDRWSAYFPERNKASAA